MTVLEALQWGSEKLKAGALPEDAPMIDAEVLLAAVMDVPKSWLFTHFSQDLKPRDEETYHKFIDRRIAREPVAYIMGKKEFYGRSFKVTKDTLIPRPATETLVAAAIESSKKHTAEETVFADIGTGSGAIALSLAAETGIPVIATDASRGALEIARENARLLGYGSLFDAREGDLIEPLLTIFRALKKQDTAPVRHLVLCANLPYLTQAQVEETAADVRTHEPRGALIGGGDDGLDLYRHLLQSLRAAREILPEHVTILFEIDPSQREAIRSLIRAGFPLAMPRILEDMQGLDRVVVAAV